MRVILLVIIVLLISLNAAAREQYPGQYQNSDPATQEWFKNQKSPKTGGLCCNEADGEMVEEDIRNGQYWVRSPKTIANAQAFRLPTEWLEVPDEVVIKTPNKMKRAVAWYVFQNGQLQVRCFAPGSLF